MKQPEEMAKKLKKSKPAKSIAVKKRVSTARKISAKKSKPKKYVKKKTAVRSTKNSKVKKKNRNKTVGKTRARNKRNDRPKEKGRKTKLLSKSPLRKAKSVRKNVRKSKVSVSPQPARSNRKGVKQKVKTTRRNTKKDGGRLITKKSSRANTPQIDFTFSGVRKIDKKINLFKKYGKQQIQKVVKTGTAKPPRGIIVTVRDKKGREKTESSRFDFVVNTDSVQGFVEGMIDRMKDDYLEWIEMNEGNEESGDDVDSDPYKDYNPDTITEMTIKFIY